MLRARLSRHHSTSRTAPDRLPTRSCRLVQLDSLVSPSLQHQNAFLIFLSLRNVENLEIFYAKKKISHFCTQPGALWVFALLYLRDLLALGSHRPARLTAPLLQLTHYRVHLPSTERPHPTGPRAHFFPQDQDVIERKAHPNWVETIVGI